MTNGSTTKLLYIKQGDAYYSRVETETPLVRRSSLSMPIATRGKGSIVVCTTVYSKPDKLEDWLIEVPEDTWCGHGTHEC